MKINFIVKLIKGYFGGCIKYLLICIPLVILLIITVKFYYNISFTEIFYGSDSIIENDLRLISNPKNIWDEYLSNMNLPFVDTALDAIADVIGANKSYTSNKIESNLYLEIIFFLYAIILYKPFLLLYNKIAKLIDNKTQTPIISIISNFINKAAMIYIITVDITMLTNISLRFYNTKGGAKTYFIIILVVIIGSYISAFFIVKFFNNTMKTSLTIFKLFIELAGKIILDLLTTTLILMSVYIGKILIDTTILLKYEDSIYLAIMFIISLLFTTILLSINFSNDKLKLMW